MKSIILLVLMSCVSFSVSEHLILGKMDKSQLMHHSVAQYYAIPFTKRVKEIFFASPDQRTINSVVAYDNLHSKATVAVTAGGIGFTYVNIRMKSERGRGLNYDIGIYA